jgi:NAD(P)-dependent dehydrogenase (short-subunit alcohol dehydrogenase family)
MGQVDGKVAIVTGGASGIGAACAAALAREGAKVVITDLDDAGGQAVAEKIGGAGGEAIYFHQDVSVEEGWPAIIETAERRFGRLDVIVANAGIGILCKAVEMTLADWRRQTAVNLDGVFLSVKYAVPAMRRAGGGSIIIMSSVAGLRGSAGLAGYCATKEGCACLQKRLRWSVRQPTTGFGSIRSIRGSSIRRFGQRWRVQLAATCRSIRTGSPKPGCRSGRRGHRKTSQTVCSSLPRTRPTT